LFHCCYKKFVIFLLLDEKAVNENGLSFYWKTVLKTFVVCQTD
jgi:hypothetical protein